MSKDIYWIKEEKYKELMKIINTSLAKAEAQKRLLAEFKTAASKPKKKAS